MAFATAGLALAAAASCAEAGVDSGAPIGANGKGGAGTGGGNGIGNGGNGNVGGLNNMLIGDPNEGQGCNDLSVKFDKQIPTVLLVVDRSTSMSDEKYGIDTRWNVLKQAILDPAKGLIKPLEGEVRFGLLTYTSTAQDATCPTLGKVELAMGNYEKINAFYGPLATPSGKGETPTAEGMQEAVKVLDAYGEPGPKVIVLATDGEPDTCPGTCTGDCPVSQKPNFPRDPNCGHDESVAAVQAAFVKGIRTYVVAIGNSVGADHLQAVANAGQGLPPVLGSQLNWLTMSCNYKTVANLKAKWVQTDMGKATSYRPEDPAALSVDLQKIIGLVRSCSFKLKGTVETGKEKQGTVLLDGLPLLYDDPNGWRMTSPTDLEVTGAACQKIQSESKNIFITFPCGIFNPE